MSPRRTVETAENAEQRRLPGAGRAHDGDEVPFVDDEADAAQRLDGDVAAAVNLRYIGDIDDRRVAVKH
jgi:hypothetical protein